jgi:hypothetical protein
MNHVVELVRRTEKMQSQVEVLRAELAELRRDLDRLQNGAGPVAPERDCLVKLLFLAEDLGPDFSSQDPHKLAGRGDVWFGEP